MLPLYILLTCLSSIAWGRPTNPSEFCFGGCELALGIFKFNDSSSSPADASALRAKNGCDNEFQVPSLYLCLKIFCTVDERVRGLSNMNETCQRRSNITIPPFSIVDGYSDEDIDGLRHLQPEEIPKGREFVLNEVAVPSKQVFKLAFDTLDAAYFETRIHNVYGCAMYYFWAIVIIIGLSSHLGPYLLTFRNHDGKWQSLPNDDIDIDVTEEPSQKRRRSIFDTPYTLLKRYITVPATFGYKRSQNVWWCTIPTRVQSLAIGAFIVINIVLCSCSYRVFPNNIYWPRVYDQTLRYFADRTGIISTANLPLIWIFGIRNNTLMWLTGWDFATYNNFHRWVARVSTFEAVLHSLAYTVMIVAAWAYYLTYYQQKYFVNGVLATIFMVAVLVASVYPLRRSFYEIFLWLHIILSVLVIITMYYHVEIFRGYTNYIYPCIFIWIFDRLLRTLRILSFNPQFWNTHANITYSPHSNIVRLTVPYTTSFIKPRPGTFYYIYVLDNWRFWENHPFTLGFATPETQAGSPVHSPSSSINPTAQPTPSTLTFLIRPYKGFTSRLRSSCLTSPSRTSTHRVLIEGPYGETQPFHSYTNILFIVGGTGIAVPLSYLNTLLSSDSDSNSKARTTTTSINIVWAVRERAFLDEVVGRDFREALWNDKDDDNEGIDTDTGIDIDIKCPGQRKAVKIQRGRPNVFSEVENAVRDADSNSYSNVAGGGGDLAVVACGPGMMADDARRAVVSMLGRGVSGIEYFEESFNW
ncbi:ferric reductase like transmembrane component [Cadophora sp. DSE1049]|nr:ferric reductase like transmembrane component [Cadophora sp. DSE1049]